MAHLVASIEYDGRLRQVRDERTRYIITYRGQPVGVLLPLPETEVEDQLLNESPARDPWEELTELGQEIGAGWQSDQSGAETCKRLFWDCRENN